MNQIAQEIIRCLVHDKMETQLGTDLAVPNSSQPEFKSGWAWSSSEFKSNKNTP